MFFHKRSKVVRGNPYEGSSVGRKWPMRKNPIWTLVNPISRTLLPSVKYVIGTSRDISDYRNPG